MKRRAFLTGIAAALAAPAIVKTGVLMPVRPLLIGVDVGAGDFASITLFHRLVDPPLIYVGSFVWEEMHRLGHVPGHIRPHIEWTEGPFARDLNLKPGGITLA